eukprot:1195608-Prorocentrum_minimum.AAC.5
MSALGDPVIKYSDRTAKRDRARRSFRRAIVRPFRSGSPRWLYGRFSRRFFAIRRFQYGQKYVCKGPPAADRVVADRAVAAWTRPGGGRARHVGLGGALSPAGPGGSGAAGGRGGMADGDSVALAADQLGARGARARLASAGAAPPVGSVGAPPGGVCQQHGAPPDRPRPVGKSFVHTSMLKFSRELCAPLPLLAQEDP